MIYISHRGNLNGKNPDKENHPEYIMSAIKKGYDVEVDVWYKHGWWLGHDIPQHKIDFDFLETKGLWIHAKNIESVEQLSDKNINWFWHENDKVTITKCGYIWCFPNNECDGGIMVEFGQNTNKKIIGVCSDSIEKWKYQ